MLPPPPPKSPPRPGDAYANHLIAALPDDERATFIACCEHVELTAGQVLCEPGQHIRYVYFPTSTVITLVSSERSFQTLEMCLVGPEGMLGVSLAVNVDVADMQALAHAPGYALRVAADAFRRLAAQCRGLRQAADAYLYAFMTQLSRLGPCTRQHSYVSRLARCLLMTLDRARSDQFQLMPQILGPANELAYAPVAAAAQLLQSKALIQMKGDAIRILDRTGLEGLACQCYAAERETFTQLVSRASSPP